MTGRPICWFFYLAGDLLVIHIEAHHVVAAQLHACIPDSLQDDLSPLHIPGQRFFTQDVFAGPCRFQTVGLMKPGGGGNVDGVHRSLGQQLRLGLN